jgi:hypothetical protein
MHVMLTKESVNELLVWTGEPGGDATHGSGLPRGLQGVRADNTQGLAAVG